MFPAGWKTLLVQNNGYFTMYSFAFLKCDQQIEDVNKKFDDLKKLQDNEWQPLDVPSKAVVKV